LNHGKPPLEVAQVTGQQSDIISFVCSEAVDAGDWVDLNDGATAGGEARIQEVVQGNGTGLCIGVALETVTAAQITAAAADGDVVRVRVCVAGYCENAKTDGSVAGAGDTLIPAGTGGCAKGQPTNVLPIIGFALESDGSGTTADVYIIRRY
jgi:hypothetical protein